MSKHSALYSFKWLLIMAIAAVVLAACGNKAENNTAPAEQTPAVQESPSPTDNAHDGEQHQTAAKAFELITAEMGKAKDGGAVDYDLVEKTYAESLKSLAEARDSEQSETTGEQIAAAIAAAKAKEMDGAVAKQIVDKLLQKVFYLSLKAELKEAADNWSDKAKVADELAEAENFYRPVLENTVKKRDAAYGTHMVDDIAGALTQIKEAVSTDSQLDFQLARQVVDKTLMKTFYLAVGGAENGYAYKVEKAAAAGEADVQVEQAEGWAFFQSLSKYISGSAKEEADLINKSFDLATDPKTIKAEAIHHAFIRGLTKVAIHEYEESAENWGQDKAVITGLEGALFINMIDSDIKSLLGDKSFETLHGQAESYLAAAKKADKDEAEKLRAAIRATLDEVIQKAQ